MQNDTCQGDERHPRGNQNFESYHLAGVQIL